MLAELTLALAALAPASGTPGTVHTVVHVPEPVATPRPLGRADVRVVLQANETHFVATNPAIEPVVLVFGTEDLGVVSTVRLAPGGQVVYPHAGGDEMDVWVEVVTRTSNRGGSGAHCVADIAARGGALWIVQHDRALHAFRAAQEPGKDGVRRTEPTGDLVLHVPGDPGARPKDDAPPVVGDGPLPVV